MKLLKTPWKVKKEKKIFLEENQTFSFSETWKTCSLHFDERQPLYLLISFLVNEKLTSYYDDQQVQS